MCLRLLTITYNSHIRYSKMLIIKSPNGFGKNDEVVSAAATKLAKNVNCLTADMALRSNERKNDEVVGSSDEIGGFGEFTDCLCFDVTLDCY